MTANVSISVSSSVLLDTNIVIALFAGDSAVIEKLAETDEVFVPSIVLGNSILEHAIRLE